MSDREEEYIIDLTGHWQTRAACRSMAPDLFFPTGTKGAALEEIAAAKEVCFGCEVRAECLDFALSTSQEFGVWGGTSEDERRALRRHWRRRTAGHGMAMSGTREPSPVGASAHSGEATA